MFCRFALDHVRMLRADEIFHHDYLITKIIFSFEESDCVSRSGAISYRPAKQNHVCEIHFAGLMAAEA